MPKHTFKIETGTFGLSITEPTPAPADACAAVMTGYTDFTCQVQSGMLTPTANVTQETVAATFCDPEENTPVVAKTSWTLDVTFLQDPDLMNGLSRFLMEHDTETAWFYLGLTTTDPPKATGKVRVVAGAFGGDARTVLTASISLPVDGTPGICFGDAATSAPVPAAGVPLAAEPEPAP